MNRRFALAFLATGLAFPRAAQATAASSETVMHDWYSLILELVRHTATYSPPVASRAFAYLSVTLYEALAGGTPGLRSLAGQLKAFSPPPQRESGASYSEAVIVNAALRTAVNSLFWNTGPTGQRALKAMGRKMDADVSAGSEDSVVKRSNALGEAIAHHILDWSQDDGGAVIQNMGFSPNHTLGNKPSSWVPTNTLALQQKPLLPSWGNNRCFVLNSAEACALPPPPAYSEDPGSAFYKEAAEVHKTVNNLTPEQRTIARFWSDDPMLSPTPPGHWISIVLQIMAQENLNVVQTAEALVRMSIAVSDGFVACWHSKFKYDLLRPVTYIKRVIDPKWEPILITPPFPEYPSGHSTQSGAAATVLTHVFGENFAFTDTTHERDGLAPRRFGSFWEAANEAGISRLYGGIHFRSGIDRGLEQGRCVGGHVNSLVTRI